jgi:membrane protease YdiL (CAAX protease family)
MSTILTGFIDLILAGYILHRVLCTSRTYQQLKRDLKQGDPKARNHYYQRILTFECISATLALVALQFNIRNFQPGSLALTHSSILPLAVQGGDFSEDSFLGIISGLVGGLVFATAAAILIRIWKNRQPQREQKKRWWHRFVPDFMDLLPTTPRERLLFAAVAISAGVCEELVFRGWLLYTLHNQLALNGTALILVGAACFGLAHYYQGAIGMIGTAFAAVLFTSLYVLSGSLLLPILLHILIDLRWVLLPARRGINLPELATENFASAA